MILTLIYISYRSIRMMLSNFIHIVTSFSYALSVKKFRKIKNDEIGMTANKLLYVEQGNLMNILTHKAFVKTYN